MHLHRETALVSEEMQSDLFYCTSVVRQLNAHKSGMVGVKPAGPPAEVNLNI